MKSIIDRIFSTRMLALLVALCATGGAWADTLRVLGDDVAIHSTSASGNLNRSGYAITTGTLSFNTPAGCSAGDPLLFTKLQMISEGTQNNYTYAQTITITVDGQTYTSSTVVGPASESIGNVGSQNVLTYNFPDVPVQAGSSYSITFNNAGSVGIRYGVENTNNCTGYIISLTGSSDNWHPYGVITATPFKTSNATVGSKILISNTGTTDSLQTSANAECNFAVTIPAMTGLPVGSVIKVTRINFASWNNNYVAWDGTNSKSDPYGIYLNGVRSLNLKGNNTYSTDPGTIDLTVAKIKANSTTYAPRLSFAFSDTCNLTVGTTYTQAINDNLSKSDVGKGVSFLHYNGNQLMGSSIDRGSVRYVEATSGIMSATVNSTACYPVYEMYAEVVSKPAQTATISSTDTYTLSGLFDGVASDGIYTVNVNESATLNIDSNTTVELLTINVAKGKTLTVTGGSLAVSSDFVVNGDGYVNLTSATVSGTLKGDGTVVYTGTATPSGLVFTDTAWEGTLWLEKKTGVTAWEPTSYGSANSTIRMTGIQLYFNTLAHASANISFDGTLEVTDTYSDGTAASYGIEINNGFSTATTTFGALKGDGTIQDTNQGASPLLVFNDASEFEGTINLSYNGKKIRIGTSGDVSAGQIYIASGKTVTVDSGKTWTTSGGIVVNGTLILEGKDSRISGTVSGSGNVFANQSFPVTGSGFTGTLTIDGDPTNGTTTEATVIYGSRLNVASGMVGVTGNVTTLPSTIDIQSGASFWVVNSSVTSLDIALGIWNGQLNIAGCTGLTSLTLDVGTDRSITASKLGLPSGNTLATVNVVVKEEHGNGGSITLNDVTGLPAVDGRAYNYSVVREDGATVSATFSNGVLTYAPAISGAATMYDVSFLNTKEFVYKRTASANIGLDTAQDPKYNNSLNDATTGIYLRHHPYVNGAKTDIHGLTDFTVVVVGQMSPTHKTQFIHIGSTTGSNKGLLIATTDKDDEVIIVPNTGKVVDESNYVKVKVPNAASARHAYVIKKSGNVFTVWVDGIKRGNFTVAAGWEIGSSDHAGVQVGSDFGGEIQRDTSNPDRYKSVADSLEETGVVNVIRIFDYVITDAQAQAIVAAYPYVSEGGLYTRTISAAADLSATDAWAKNGSDTPYALPEGATVEEVFYNPSATVTVGADATLTVNANLTVDTLTVESTGGHTLSMASDGTHAIGVSGAAVVNSPLSITYGALSLAGTPVQLGTGGSLRFDCSGIDISEVYTTTRYQLTGLMDQDDTKVTVVVPTAPARTATKNYNANGYYELVVTPDHEAGSNVYYKSGYFGKGGDQQFSVVLSDGTTSTVVFPGDTVVIDSKSSQDPIYVGELPDNVAAISIARTTKLASGNKDNAMLNGATVTVAAGGALTIYRDWNEIKLGDVVFNGLGVTLDQSTSGNVSDGQSRVLSVVGAVSGSAPLTIVGEVSVASSGSIANTISGSGTITYAALPSAVPAGFSSWTGTVKLPAIASGGIIFNNYGTTGSTVYLTSMSSGAWIDPSYTTINPKLYLAGNMTLTAMSTRTYTFAEIDGPGNLSFATSAGEPTVNITKVAEGYSGTISSTLGNPVTIATLDRARGTSTASGTKLLSTGGTGSFSVGSVTIGGDPADLILEIRTEGEPGVYIAAPVIEPEGESHAVDVDELTGDIAISGDVTTVSHYDSENQRILLKVSYSGTTAAYNILSIDGEGAVSLNGSATVDGVKVEPEVNTSSDPMTLSGATPNFTVKTIPGLYYTVQTCDSATGDFSAAGATVQATTASTSLNTGSDSWGENQKVKYYKIKVSTTND